MKKLALSLVLVGWAVLHGSLAYAQDVTVGDMVWSGPGSSPDTLPVANRRLRPEYPEEMLKTEEIGYVLLSRYIDDDGKSLMMRADGSHPAFQRSVENAFEHWDMRPATTGGKSVNARIWIPIIFNPKTAAAKGPNATPRLLMVTRLIVPELPDRGTNEPVEVRTRVKLDETGVITSVVPASNVPDLWRDAIATIVKGWSFSPARNDNQPVAAEVVIPVVCEPINNLTLKKTVPPKAIRQKAPVYPYAMRLFGLKGTVLLDFIVDPSGKVLNPVVLESDNPAFDEPAIAALREWKFEPGTEDGRPVASHSRVPFVFLLRDSPDGYMPPGDGGDNAFSVPVQKDQSKLPPQLRYDTAPKIRGVMIAVYPYAQRRDNVKGKAKVGMLIDPRGRVVDVKVTSADRPEFGLALSAAIEGFRFDPALKDGKPVPHVLNFEQTFSDEELPDPIADRLITLEKKHPEKIVTASSLDEPLKPLSRRSPLFPLSLDAKNVTGEALIECLIDEDGHVKLPRIVSASDPAFGYAAIQACATWWFEPPKSGGKPAVVRVQVPVSFKMPVSGPKTVPAVLIKQGE